MSDEIKILREDANLMALFIGGKTPDKNTQTDAEVQATEDAVQAAVNRAMERMLQERQIPNLTAKYEYIKFGEGIYELHRVPVTTNETIITDQTNCLICNAPTDVALCYECRKMLRTMRPGKLSSKQ